jgi:hypothetical protein
VAFKVLTAVKISMVFRSATPWGLVGRYQLQPWRWRKYFLRNVGIYLQVNTALQNRTTSTGWRLFLNWKEPSIQPHRTHSCIVLISSWIWFAHAVVLKHFQSSHNRSQAAAKWTALAMVSEGQRSGVNRYTT